MSRFLRIACLGALLLATACRSSTPAASAPMEIVGDSPFSVQGVVLDAAGRPVPDATVALALDGVVYNVVTPLSEATTSTNADGEFSFLFLAGGRDAPTLVRLTATHSSFQPAEVLEPYSSETLYRLTLKRLASPPH